MAWPLSKPPMHEPLTPDEGQLLEELEAGCGRRAIAVHLQCSQERIDHILRDIWDKWLEVNGLTRGRRA